MLNSPKKVLVTGGAGFIGSTLVDRLLQDGHDVIAYDNFSTGMEGFLGQAQTNPRFRLMRGDILDIPDLTAAMNGIDFVFHMAANADVRFGTQHPRRDLEQNTIGTFNVLEAVRTAGVGGIAFSSTGSIYGDLQIIPAPEDAPFPVQTSMYGASKLAGEGLLQAYAEGYGLRAFIFRFVSVLGERYTHGHVFDFYKRLLQDPTRLEILGDGRQRKSYMYVQDCIDGMLLAINTAEGKANVFNLGTNEYTEVNQSVAWITAHLGLDPVLSYTGGDRGWVGDSPFIFLETKRIGALGWRPKLGIRDGILATLDWLRANHWVLERRA